MVEWITYTISVFLAGAALGLGCGFLLTKIFAQVILLSTGRAINQRPLMLVLCAVLSVFLGCSFVLKFYSSFP